MGYNLNYFDNCHTFNTAKSDNDEKIGANETRLSPDTIYGHYFDNGITRDRCARKVSTYRAPAGDGGLDTQNERAATKFEFVVYTA